MSQSFFVVSPKIGDFANQYFANQFLDTVLQCCPTVFGRFAHPEAHFFFRFLEFGREEGNFFEKKQNKSCYFQNVFNFLAADFSLAAGIFCFFRQFSVCFQVSHFIPIHKIRKRGYQIQQIQFAMQKAASNTRKTITVSHSAIHHFLAIMRKQKRKDVIVQLLAYPGTIPASGLYAPADGFCTANSQKL